MPNQNRVKAFLFNEVSVFIYLWIIYLFLPELLDLESSGMDLELDEVILTGFYFILATLNNFALIPRYLSHGRQWRYLLVILGVLLLFSLGEETVLEWLLDDDERRIDFGMRGVTHAFVRMGTIVIIFGSFKLIWDHQERLQQMSALEKERVESELKFLKSQINPHVMFNHLNSIYYYTLEKSDKAPQMLLKLSEIMRYMLYEANERFVSLQKELDYIRNYIDLEKIRLEDRGEVKFEVEGDTDNLRIAPLLLISFIENSFKHSMQTQDDDIWIQINIDIEDDWLEFRAENSWSQPREEPDGRPDQEGIGLQNVRKRLQLLYPNRHSLHISRSDDLFLVHLRIKLHHGKH
ncbi:MAG: histidine kinase [Balneolaceae bacterium]|nr:histidine kinase [Balneolaceae bacterium]